MENQTSKSFNCIPQVKIYSLTFISLIARYPSIIVRNDTGRGTTRWTAKTELNRSKRLPDSPWSRNSETGFSGNANWRVELGYGHY